jgi:hypothetical protein
MAGGAAVMYHAGKSTQAGRDQNAAQDAEIQQLAAQQAAPPPMPAAAPGGMTQDTINELSQLGQLHEQGVLTDEEFAAQKAKLLNS